MRQSEPSFVYRVKISGEAGDGIMSAGDLFMRVAAREGFEATVVKSFPSTIRGGYAQSLVTITDRPIISPLDYCDMLFALSRDAFLLDTVGLKPHTIILVESTAHTEGVYHERFDQLTSSGYTPFSVPVLQFARETAGNCTLRSTVALGVLVEMLGLSSKVLFTAIAERFREKGTELVELNHIALESGCVWARHHIEKTNMPVLPYRNPAGGEGKLVIEGNQAIALGALAAGCTFFASYPITPATAIGETLARQIHLTGGFAYQAEDEIAALGSALGASFSGAKAMTATSGPGLSLMQEFLGYASIVELPVVVIDVQRVGPSTGMPTKHSQDDLFAAVFGGHGEGQRIVIAPVSVEECFLTTVTAFNCAEKYQCPVIVLSDSTLGSTKTVMAESALKYPRIVNREVFTGNQDRQLQWMRYRLTDSGLNPMTVPGISPVTYRATGVEHNEYSTPVTTPDERSMQIAKRFRKLRDIEKEFDDPVIWDIEAVSDEPITMGVCAWGLTASITREAVAVFRSEGVRIAALYPRLLFPVCIEAFNRWADYSPLQIVVEANYTGQFCSLIRMSTRARPQSLTISRGEPFTPTEIVRGIRSIINNGALK